MLTISQVAARYGLSNRQVHDLIRLGSLPIALTIRENQGIVCLISEQDLDKVDIYSLLADVRDNNNRRSCQNFNPGLDWKRLSKTMAHYQRFMEEIQDLNQPILLENCFYLFHLNHYAKRNYADQKQLYGLKKQVLKKMHEEFGDLFRVVYLVGPDRRKVWLCDDCKENARKAAIPYAEYARREYYCTKCFVQNLEKEYYSLVQFDLEMGRCRFSFHLPRSSARWLGDLQRFNQETRKAGNYSDKLYLYGRPVSRIEEQAYPLSMIIEKLNLFINNTPAP